MSKQPERVKKERKTKRIFIYISNNTIRSSSFVSRVRLRPAAAAAAAAAVAIAFNDEASAST